jgi:RTX calcium-binding nonapeptide repeat (4 copies)
VLDRVGSLTVLVTCAFAALPLASAGATTYLGAGPSTVYGDPIAQPAVAYQPDTAEPVHLELTQTATDLVVTAASAVAFAVQAPCVQDSATVARCPVAQAKAFVLNATAANGPLHLVADPAVTADLYAQGSPALADVLRGGAGDDLLDALGAFSAAGEPLAADDVSGGAGDDVLSVGGAGIGDGGPGDDGIVARDGDRLATLHGGDGDDLLSDAAAADGGAGDDELIRALVADGGDGDDKLYGAWRGTGGAGDDFLSNTSEAGPSTLDGGPGDDGLSSGGAGSVAHGGPGNDRLYEGQGADNTTAVLYGDEGDDRLEGEYGGATLDGGAGNDQLANVYSNVPNPLLPWPGNTFLGGPGNDTVTVKDNVADRVDCGADLDSIAHDAIDTFVNCETDLDPGPATKGHPAIVPSGKVPVTRTPATVSLRGGRVRATAKGAVRVALTCAKGTTCTGLLRLTSGKSLLASTTAKKVKGTTSITLKLTTKARKLLRRRGTLKATLTFTPTTAPFAIQPPRARTLTLLAPRHR